MVSCTSGIVTGRNGLAVAEEAEQGVDTVLVVRVHIAQLQDCSAPDRGQDPRIFDIRREIPQLLVRFAVNLHIPPLKTSQY